MTNLMNTFYFLWRVTHAKRGSGTEIMSGEIDWQVAFFDREVLRVRIDDASSVLWFNTTE
jgi:hypothetical protein